MKRRADTRTCKHALKHTHAFKHDQILHPASKTMWSSSPDGECKTEYPAVALQAERELKCQTVTAIVL